jgi:hypothetical protein
MPSNGARTVSEPNHSSADALAFSRSTKCDSSSPNAMIAVPQY